MPTALACSQEQAVLAAVFHRRWWAGFAQPPGIRGRMGWLGERCAHWRGYLVGATGARNCRPASEVAGVAAGAAC